MIIYSLENGMYLGISYFQHVKNVKWLKNNISKYFKNRSPVLIRRSLIVDPFQIVVAVNNACLTYDNCNMVTKTLATEILFNLSSTKNISQSLNDCSAANEDDEFIIAIVSELNDVAEMKIFSEKCLDGQEINSSNITKNVNTNFVQSYYNINEEEIKNCNLLDSIISRIACKYII
ncbi:EKC/KEOPS complex subunit TPRKB-like [Daktulosphaira vitifoliae]|uniref:EKC/KEOPS complex subunit TPRKB-like n=1 Tax=Daktulosphaira vitifoliae TaxID=58002 RepID=UPI0021A97F52|nr:EKC/KEOPS complex subunit TPRKB-like [Daktulosphaira vitifoliae]